MAKAVSALKDSKKLSTNFSEEGSKTVTAKISGKILQEVVTNLI